MTVSVLVVGDVMVDDYVVGRATRVSPEAPVPVILVDDQHDQLGGAANVARQVTALGGRAMLVGVVGDDASGEVVRRHCDECGIDRRGLIADASRITTTKQRLMAGRQQIARIDREDVRPIDADVEARIVDTIESILSGPEPPGAVVVSDYAKGVVTAAVLEAAVGGARDRGIVVLVDPKHADVERYRGATVLKANAVEFEAALGRAGGDDVAAALAADGQRLLEHWGVDHLVVTVGAGGLFLLSGGVVTEMSASPRRVYDVSGAGDTVIATMGILMGGGADVATSAAIANVAAGVTVEQPGVGLVTRSELTAALTASVGSKEMSVDLLVERCRTWRAEGRRIVLTNGCFDLFHAGHARLLREAAATGDALVVAVDTDESVRDLKGDGRPIVGQRERTAIIAALACVDAVVTFHSAELRSLVEAVQPDVLVKGADYAVDDVVGADLVIGRGGRVELVPLVGELSTTALVGRIRGG